MLTTDNNHQVGFVTSKVLFFTVKTVMDGSGPGTLNVTNFDSELQINGSKASKYLLNISSFIETMNLSAAGRECKHGPIKLELLNFSSFKVRHI